MSGIAERDVGLAVPILAWTRTAWALLFVHTCTYAFYGWLDGGLCFNVLDRFVTLTAWRTYLRSFTLNLHLLL